MDPLMGENFFIENPEQFENNFYNKDASKEFQKNFGEKSKEFVHVMSMRNRHHKKLKKKKTRQNQSRP